MTALFGEDDRLRRILEVGPPRGVEGQLMRLVWADRCDEELQRLAEWIRRLRRDGMASGGKEKERNQSYRNSHLRPNT